MIAAATIARTIRNIALGSLRFRFSTLFIAQKSFAHSRARTQKRGGSRSAAEDEPKKFGVEEKNDGGDAPGQDLCCTRVYKPTHLRAVSGELNQGNNGKGQ